MPNYELTCIFHPSLSTDEVGSRVARVEQEVAQHGAVLSTDIWGRMRLAYPIEKVLEGTYAHYTIDVPGQAISDLERWLHLQENILRHLVVKGITAYEKTPTSIAQGARERVVSPSRLAPAAPPSDIASNDENSTEDGEESVSTEIGSETIETSEPSDVEESTVVDTSLEVEKADE
ncbi:MAG: 30S ribosomal protein S6 [Chloroflexota bacterium]|nr:30S ribosomal protein S6 [Chloroflexota bacterium]